MGILGIVWKNKKEWEARSPSALYIAVVDCTTGEIKHKDSHHWQDVAEDIRLWPGFTLDEWIITWQVARTANILLCPFHFGTTLTTVTPVVIDTVTEDMTGIGPVVFVTATEQDIRVVHLQPLLDDTSPPFVRVSRIVRKHLDQPNRAGFMKPILEYLWLGGTVQTKAIEDALKAEVAIRGQTWYLVTFNAEENMNEEFEFELPEIGIRKVQGKPYWRFKIAGGHLPLSKLMWKYLFRIQIPANSDPYASFFEDVIVGTYLIAGPTWITVKREASQTIVAAVGLIKKEALGLPEEQARPLRGGALLCLSSTGQVVQECKEEIVEQVELCLVGDTVIGVDRIQRRWRLWCWEPLTGKEQFSTVQWLDESVVHAHVVTNHENSDPQGTQFWLVEERPKGLAVSRRDGQTLEEIEEPITLTGWSLPYALDRPVGEWDWPVKKGLIGYQDALLLIAADEENQMVLYRVEAGTEER